MVKIEVTLALSPRCSTGNVWSRSGTLFLFSKSLDPAYRDPGTNRSRAELLSRAASRSPARAIASGGKGRGAHPRAADEQLVGGGDPCALPKSKVGRVYNWGRGACREAGERVRGGSDGMHGARLSKGWGPRARAERTRNIWLMSVTLDVSKLSGWLKAAWSCRVEGRARDAGGGEVRAGRREGLGCGGGTTSGMHGDGPGQGLGAKGTRGERT